MFGLTTTLRAAADWIDALPRNALRAGLETVDRIITATSTHAIPEGDGYAHILQDCPCGPWITRCTVNGRLDWIVEHVDMSPEAAQFAEDHWED